MNRPEAVRLVAIISALCPGQKLADLTPDAWQLVLDDVSYDDAQQAVRAVYRRLAEKDDYQGYARIEAKDVLAEVRRMWRRRLDRLDPEHLVPPAGLSVLEDMEWRRATIRAIAAGAPVPTNTRGELKPRDLRQLTAGAGHECTCTPTASDYGPVHSRGCARRRTVDARTNQD